MTKFDQWIIRSATSSSLGTFKRYWTVFFASSVLPSSFKYMVCRRRHVVKTHGKNHRWQISRIEGVDLWDIGEQCQSQIIYMGIHMIKNKCLSHLWQCYFSFSVLQMNLTLTDTMKSEQIEKPQVTGIDEDVSTSIWKLSLGISLKLGGRGTKTLVLSHSFKQKPEIHKVT